MKEGVENLLLLLLLHTHTRARNYANAAGRSIKSICCKVAPPWWFGGSEEVGR